MSQTSHPLKIYFSDFFGIDPADLDAYGAFNISLINDLPLFVDPFLLFNSRDPRYQELHNEIVRYVCFLRDKASLGTSGSGLLRAWFTFSEVKQNWLGYSRVGNSGSGLGMDFASAFHDGLQTVFRDFGHETISDGSHIEKIALIRDGVGRDNISDFTVNLIKEYLLEYTQEFARTHLRPAQRKRFAVEKVRFNYDTESWERETYELPFADGAYVVLTPRNLLTKEDIWINRSDLLNEYDDIALSIPNDQLRDQISNYFVSQLPRHPKRKDRLRAVADVVRKFPEFVEYYIRFKEEHGDEAQAISDRRVTESEHFFVAQVIDFVELLSQSTEFFGLRGSTYDEARARAMFLKDVIETKGGHRIFYLDGKPVRKEHDLQILFRLTWFATPSDVSREVNDGRGPVDFKVSRGSKDKSVIEFKLASNSQLERNLRSQVEIYQRASDAQRALKVIIYFSFAERQRVERILKNLNMEESQDIILIDGRRDNKPSGSKA